MKSASVTGSRRLANLLLFITVWLIPATVLPGDPIAVIVNQRNPILHLTTEQVAGIYRGEDLHWLNGERIKIVNREISSSLRAEFYRKVLNAKPDQPYYHLNTPVPIQNLIERSDEGVLRFVGAIEGAIGYVKLSKMTGGDSGVKVILIIE